MDTICPYLLRPILSLDSTKIKAGTIILLVLPLCHESTLRWIYHNLFGQSHSGTSHFFFFSCKECRNLSLCTELDRKFFWVFPALMEKSKWTFRSTQYLPNCALWPCLINVNMRYSYWLCDINIINNFSFYFMVV